jgi:hypothetical protein
MQVTEWDGPNRRSNQNERHARQKDGWQSIEDSCRRTFDEQDPPEPKCGMHSRVFSFVRMIAGNGVLCKGKLWGHLVPEITKDKED